MSDMYEIDAKGGRTMTLMRGFAKVEKGGRIPIPKNMRREAALTEGQLVELKVQGPAKSQFIIIRKRTTPR